MPKPLSKASKPKPCWPIKSPGDDDMYHELVGCDLCMNWYHIGCSGMKEGDPRLEDDAEWLCPDCEALDQPQRVRAITESPPRCQRPPEKCFYWSFSPRRFIARKPNPDTASPGSFLWLVHWYGWGVDASTWEPETKFDEDTNSAFRDAFYTAAQKDGLDLSNDNATIFLLEVAFLQARQYVQCLGWDGQHVA